MNFQAITNANGQSLQIFATILEVGNSKLSREQKPYQPATLVDDNNEKHQVTIFQGDGRLLDNTCLGKRMAFSLSTYQGQRGLAYSGFWNDKATQGQSQAPQRPQQAPQQPAQRPNAPKEVDWDAKELREKRGYAIRDAVLVQTTLATISNNIASYISKDLILDLAEEFVEYVYHGITKAKTNGQQDGRLPVPQAERDEIDDYLD